MKVNTNIAALSAQRNLDRTSKALARALERLSTGKRINSARVDAAGLAISSGLEAQVRSMRQATRNLNDVFGFLNTAEGVMQTQTELIQRMRELSMQAANGTYSDSDRANLDIELQQLLEEFKRVSKTASFNGVNLLDGTFGTRTVQVGARAHEEISISLPTIRAEEMLKLSSTESENIGTGAFTASQSLNLAPYAPTSTLQGPLLADLNADSKLDAISLGSDSVIVLAGNGNGSFSILQTIVVPTSSDVQQISLADVNNDLRDDLIIVNRGGSTVSIRLANGNGTFGAGSTIAVAASSLPSDLITADFNGDSKLDIAFANTGAVGGNSVTVRLGNGDGTFGQGATFAVPSSSGAFNVKGLDLNGDSKLDLIWTNAAGSVSIRLGNGNGTFSTGATIALGSSNARGLALADFNGDSKIDFVETIAGNDSISIRLGNGNGTFAAGTTMGLPASSSLSGLPIATDINNDGKMDLLFNDSGLYIVGVRLGNGNGTFSVGTSIAFSFSSIPNVSLVDQNEDGNLDLIVNTLIAGIGVRLGNGDGTFSVSETINPAIGVLVGHASGDIDADGVADLLFVDMTAGYLYAMSGVGTEQEGEAAREWIQIRDQESAENSLELLDDALETLAAGRAEIGGLQNRLESALSVTAITIENISLAKSQIIDSDIAQETAELTKQQILQQSGIGVLQQANLNLQIVLSLLKF